MNYHSSLLTAFGRLTCNHYSLQETISIVLSCADLEIEKQLNTISEEGDRGLLNRMIIWNFVIQND